MGVDYYVIEAGSTELLVGGVPNRIGKLRRLGKSTSQTAGQVEAAAERWNARRGGMPAAVFIPGSNPMGSDSEGVVLAWEDGLGGTNDWDWDRLPVLGHAKIGPDGRMALHATHEPSEPVTLDEARAAGAVGEDGKLLRRGRPRIVEATAVRKLAYAHRNPSSNGPIEEFREEIAYRLSDGHESDMPGAPELTEEARSAVNGGALVGMTVNEAFHWAQARPRRDARAEEATIRVLGDGLLSLECGTAKVQIHPERMRAGGFGLVVRNSGGYPMSAEQAFLAAGDSLAHGADPAEARSVGKGYLAVEVGEGKRTFGLLVVARDDGGLGVMCGPAFPREMHRDTTMRHDAPEEGMGTMRALMGWPNERLAVPPKRVATFLADFALYLAECGGEALQARAEGRAADVPMLQQFLDRHGIEYGGALPSPMAR